MLQHSPGVLRGKFGKDGPTQNVSESVTQNVIDWKTSSGSVHTAVKIAKTDINLSCETKVFLRYVDDVRTVRGDTKELLYAVNNHHPNLQFTLETTDDKDSFSFLDMSIIVQPEGTIFCTWYQKPSDNGITLNYRSCAPLQHKKSMIQGTIHRLFGSTSHWEEFSEALTKN